MNTSEVVLKHFVEFQLWSTIYLQKTGYKDKSIRANSKQELHKGIAKSYCEQLSPCLLEKNENVMRILFEVILKGLTKKSDTDY